MIHTNLPRNCVVFLLLCDLTWSASYGSKKFDSHKWPTVLVDEVKGYPFKFEAYLCGSLYSTFITSFYPYAFYNKQLQTLFRTNLTDPRQREPLNCRTRTSTQWWEASVSILQSSTKQPSTFTLKQEVSKQTTDDPPDFEHNISVDSLFMLSQSDFPHHARAH